MSARKTDALLKRDHVFRNTRLVTSSASRNPPNSTYGESSGVSAVCGPLCCTFDLPNPKSEALGQSGSRFFLSVHSNLPRWQGWWRRPRGLVFSHFSLVWAICTCRQQCRNSTLTELPVLTTLNVPNVPHHHDASVNTHSVNKVHSHSTKKCRTIT